MKNIHILPTDKPSRLLVRNDKPSILMLKEHSPFATNETHTYQNIYITSDEEIKDGDWCIDINSNQPFQCLRNQKDSVYEWKDVNSWARLHKNCKKIILTTDEDLIKDGVQRIDDEFLEWFVKNPSCESVDINDWMDTDGNIAFGGDIRYQICLSPFWRKREINELEMNWVFNNPQCKQTESCSNSLSKKCICPKEEPKQTVQEYEQQGLEKYSHELKSKQDYKKMKH